jgi:hypothetical protein
MACILLGMMSGANCFSPVSPLPQRTSGISGSNMLKLARKSRHLSIHASGEKTSSVSESMKERLTKENRQPLRLPLLLGSGILAGKALSDALISIIRAATGTPEATNNWGEGLQMLGIDVVCVVLGLAGMFLAYTMDPTRNMWEGPWETPTRKNRYADVAVRCGDDVVKLGQLSESESAWRGTMIVAGEGRCVRTVVEQVRRFFFVVCVCVCVCVFYVYTLHT